jgi:hypothetical protein
MNLTDVMMMVMMTIVVVGTQCIASLRRLTARQFQTALRPSGVATAFSLML